MLTIPRTLAEPLDKVFGWALLLTSTSRSPLPPLEFAGGPRGVQIRCPTREATAEFRLDGGQVPETILAPWDLLVDTADTADTADTGRERMVELRRENGRVLAAWQNRRVPRGVPYDTTAAIEDAWPDRPEQLTENPAELLRLLPDPAAAVARLELAAFDLALLAEHLPRLPGDALPHAPVTLDIDGTAAVRTQGRGRSPKPQPAAGMELVLSGARRSGEPIHLHP